MHIYTNVFVCIYIYIAHMFIYICIYVCIYIYTRVCFLWKVKWKTNTFFSDKSSDLMHSSYFYIHTYIYVIYVYKCVQISNEYNTPGWFPYKYCCFKVCQAEFQTFWRTLSHLVFITMLWGWYYSLAYFTGEETETQKN